MPEIDLFGNVVYSKEELKEIKRKEAEEKAKKEAEEKAKAEALEKEKELKKQIKAKKKEILDKIQELINEPEFVDSPELMENLEASQKLVPNLDTLFDLDEEWNKYDAKYDQMLTLRKQKEAEKKKADEEKNAKKYKYPFLMYFGHEYRDVTGVFEEGKEYTEKQLTKALIDHGFKDFKYAQEVQWEYFEDENCLYPKFKLGNRG